MYIEVYYKLYCPGCKHLNFVSNGNIFDVTTMDVDGFECWRCHKKFPLFKEEEAPAEPLDNINKKDDWQIYYDAGEPWPKELEKVITKEYKNLVKGK